MANDPILPKMEKESQCPKAALEGDKPKLPQSHERRLTIAEIVFI